MFLGRAWQLQLGTVDGKIYKIAPYLLLKEKQDANAVAMESLRYCISNLGEPVEQRSAFFVWDALDGNVILQTAELADGFSVSTRREILRMPSRSQSAEVIEGKEEIWCARRDSNSRPIAPEFKTRNGKD